MSSMKRDSRRGTGRTCSMFVVTIRRMVSTLQWTRSETNVRSRTTCCLSVSLLTDVCCTEVLFQSNFLVYPRKLPPEDWEVKVRGCSEFQSRSVQIYGYVFHVTNGSYHGQAWKTQSFLLSEICTDTHSLDYCGKDSSRKFCWNLDGRKYRIGNVYLVIENKDYSYWYPWMILKWLKRSRIWLHVGENDEEC